MRSDQWRKPGLVDSKLVSRLKGRGFKSHLSENDVKVMPGQLKYPILFPSIIEQKQKENTGSRMGHTKRIKIK